MQQPNTHLHLAQDVFEDTPTPKHITARTISLSHTQSISTHAPGDAQSFFLSFLYTVFFSNRDFNAFRVIFSSAHVCLQQGICLIMKNG